jgi:peptidoglycan/xylan/chitin deacetylase (PgdA/CDA1 family)
VSLALALAALAAAGVVALATTGGSPLRAATVATASRSTPAPGHRPALRRRPPSRSAHPPFAATPAQLRAIDLALRYTSFVTHGVGRRREVALTFDDGPSPFTAAILKVLTRKHVPATFFVVGQQLNDFARGLRAELRAGYRLGDHTENHAWLARLRKGAQLAQIRDEALRARSLGAPFPRLFRPPYGAFNRATVAVTRSLNMLIVLWSVDPGDWRRPGAGAIVRNVLGQARPGAIVLLHDGGGPRDQTVAALPAIIDGLRVRHYRLVTVPQLLLDDPPPRHQKPPRYSGA